MPARNSPLSLNQRVIDIGNELRRLRAGMTTGGWSPDVDPVIIGHNANPSGFAGLSAVIVGVGADAQGADGVALGYGTSAYGDASVAAGLDAVAQGQRAVAIGSFSNVDGDFSTALGWSATIDNEWSTALGANAYTYGVNATAVGADSRAHQYGTALGERASADGTQSVAIGYSARATEDNQIMLGTVDAFVEIPGSGLVLTDTADGTRYLIQITSGALVLNAAP